MDGVHSPWDLLQQAGAQERKKRGRRDEDEDPDLEPGDIPPQTQGVTTDIFREMSREMVNGL